MHICLQEEVIPCQIAEVTFDVDSITGFCPSLGIAKGGIRWNVMQMPVSDLQSGYTWLAGESSFLIATGTSNPSGD